MYIEHFFIALIFTLSIDDALGLMRAWNCWLIFPHTAALEWKQLGMGLWTAGLRACDMGGLGTNANDSQRVGSWQESDSELQ